MCDRFRGRWRAALCALVLAASYALPAALALAGDGAPACCRSRCCCARAPSEAACLRAACDCGAAPASAPVPATQQPAVAPPSLALAPPAGGERLFALVAARLDPLPPPLPDPPPRALPSLVTTT